MQDSLYELRSLFGQHRDAENADYMKKYLKNQFEFFGIKTKERRQLQKQFLVEHGLPSPDFLEQVVMDLWNEPEREFHHFAQEICFKLKKSWSPEIIELFEWMATHKSWWDTVDFIASDLCGTYFKKFPERKGAILEKWTLSENKWLHRICIIFQILFKEETDASILKRHILLHKDSDDFFIQKAIGWALRQYGKTNSAWVVDFVGSNKLKPLSKREALRIILKNENS